MLRDLYQQGSAKARLPTTFDGGPPEAVLINLAGGLTGGDRLRQSANFEEGTHAIVTTQAAEKVYRASKGAAPARITNSLTVEAAVSEWLPQETIFFDGARLHRTFEAALTKDARLLACEATVFGRTAMGETVHHGYFRDDWRITVDGRLIFADGFCLDGAIQDQLDRPAIAAGGRALAVVLYVGLDSEDLITLAKGVLEPFQAAGKRAAASRIGDLIIARFIAADGLALRSMLDAYLSTIKRGAAGAPKLWRC
ncbi:MAG: urease accessory protein UreD [Pseudomonadota bacterium]